MAAPPVSYKERTLISVIGDEDTVTGLLLAGIGQTDANHNSNFTVVDAKTTKAQIETAFATYSNRKDIAIILINQHIAEQIRPLVDEHDNAFPSLLEIPSKDHAFDPSKDSILKRVRRLFGGDD